MVDSELVATLDSMASVDARRFSERVQAEAETLSAMVDDGIFDNPQALTGFEYEFYAVQVSNTSGKTDTTPGTLARVPRRLLEFIRFEKELGLHNAELSTQPLPLNADGIAAQEATLRAQLRSGIEYTDTEGLRLVSDGMWTIPPQGESATAYLTNSVEHGGHRVASNMSASPRYHAMAQARNEITPGMKIDAPHVSLSADTVLPESLITSIQPHYQVPTADTLPRYFRAALRVAGPLVALGANAPFFPPDLYSTDDGEAILEDGYHEHRIHVFESVLNDPDRRRGKVRLPEDVDSVAEAIDRIASDPVIVPLDPEPSGRFDDQFAAFRMKSGTYWRWVRPIFDGPTRSGANARIEFRPLSAQPTVRDSVAFLAAFAGLLEALPAHDHPVLELSWADAHDNFYRAANEGINAELAWITADGSMPETDEAVYRDLLAQATEGLRMRGCSEAFVDRYLDPIRARVDRWTTPADWKRSVVREHLAAGESIESAIPAMQRQYLEYQESTLFSDDFSAWLDGSI